MMASAKRGRHGVRNHLQTLLMFRHGLRVSEAIALRRSDANLDQARLWVARLKNGLSVEQPLAGDELRAIRRWQAVNYIVAQAGERAGLGHIHPQMLRHSCGFALANKGHDLRLIQDYLGASRSKTHRTLYPHGGRPFRRSLVRRNDNQDTGERI